MQYAFIMYPTAMMLCLQRGIWSQSLVTQASKAQPDTGLLFVSWIVSQCTYSYVSSEFTRSCVRQARNKMESIIHPCFCSEGLFFWPGLTFSVQKYEALVSTVSVFQGAPVEKQRRVMKNNLRGQHGKHTGVFRSQGWNHQQKVA